MGQSRLTTSNYSSDWPAYLKQANSRSQKLDLTAFTPVIVRMSERYAEKNLRELIQASVISEVIDNYDEQLAELFVSQNAQIYRANLEVKRNSSKEYIDQHYGTTAPWKHGSWVYYPWTQKLIHVLEKDLFWELRTIRNRDYIDADDQASYRRIKVGSAGMSVGSSGALALVLQGGSERLKIADGAVISGSNLNRILTGIQNVGQNKAVTIARQLYDMNPYIQLHVMSNPLTVRTIDEFFEKPWKLDVVIDEIDDIVMKIRLRVEAKKRKIPVLMATDLGDDVMLDVERFDLTPDAPLFHGIIPNIENLLDNTDINPAMFIRYSSEIIGIENMPIKLQRSAMKIGSSLPAPPQLGGATMFAGSILSYAVRQLATKGRLKSGRHLLSPERQLLEGANSFAERRKHRRHSIQLKKAMRTIKPR